MGTTRTTLENVGQGLYGKRWKTEIAADLGVQMRTVHRWIREENRIPDLNRKLNELVIERQMVLSALERETQSGKITKPLIVQKTA